MRYKPIAPAQGWWYLYQRAHCGVPHLDKALDAALNRAAAAIPRARFYVCGWWASLKGLRMRLIGLGRAAYAGIKVARKGRHLSMHEWSMVMEARDIGNGPQWYIPHWSGRNMYVRPDLDDGSMDDADDQDVVARAAWAKRRADMPDLVCYPAPSWWREHTLFDSNPYLVLVRTIGGLLDMDPYSRLCVLHDDCRKAAMGGALDIAKACAQEDLERAYTFLMSSDGRVLLDGKESP